MVWDYGEMNPFAQSAGDFGEAIEYLTKLVEHVTQTTSGSGTVGEADAATSPLPDHAASIIFTDPPYYDAIPYGHLSGFFHTWLGAVGVIQDIPKTVETRRLAECIVDEGLGKDKIFFETKMTTCLGETLRISHARARRHRICAQKHWWMGIAVTGDDRFWLDCDSVLANRHGAIRTIKSA